MKTRHVLVGATTALLLAGCHSQPSRAITPVPRTTTASRETAAATTQPLTLRPTEVPSLTVKEGPRIMWDARLNSSVIVSVEQLLHFRGLAFTPILPKFGRTPERIDVSTNPSQGAAGGLVELHYRFPRSTSFPDDGLVIVREQPVATAVGGLSTLGSGKVPSNAGRPVKVHGHWSLIHQYDGDSGLVSVRGKVLIVIAGPDISRAELIRLARALPA